MIQLQRTQTKKCKHTKNISSIFQKKPDWSKGKEAKVKEEVHEEVEAEA